MVISMQIKISIVRRKLMSSSRRSRMLMKCCLINTKEHGKCWGPHSRAEMILLFYVSLIRVKFLSLCLAGQCGLQDACLAGNFQYFCALFPGMTIIGRQFCGQENVTRLAVRDSPQGVQVMRRWTSSSSSLPPVILDTTMA